MKFNFAIALSAAVGLSGCAAVSPKLEPGGRNFHMLSPLSGDVIVQVRLANAEICQWFGTSMLKSLSDKQMASLLSCTDLDAASALPHELKLIMVQSGLPLVVLTSTHEICDGIFQKAFLSTTGDVRVETPCVRR